MRNTLPIILSLILTGCSVGMAMSGKPAPDLGAVRVGSTRGEIELQLGKAMRTVINEDGTRIDAYEYEIGNEPSAGRAVFHGTMDVLTIGLWEVIGTPVEGFQGDTYELLIEYDEDDKVKSLKGNTKKTDN